ncbi:peptide/nickel transport system substrate-binding protein [Azospirillum fermentarium]|uniref:ABC transporter substrate-binding protein n=1 Tax=Azospirillum fermentarium TaxID=1233114 RepID=UPI002226C6CD|nr:ABC transporter substrate-binding protein [Azospirillum fermentarium]MCW2245095.1 peptide/nickel transport system substrate-binding protein [Azospirillum fermentarium]
MPFSFRRLAAFGLALALLSPLPCAALELSEVPMLAEAVAAGTLPPVAGRLPEHPYVDPMNRPWQTVGRHGGTITTTMARVKDTRLMYVYGYARLVGYDPDRNLAPDILESYEVAEERSFTLHLRRGHRWSDGAPFTAEDFRYWWEDMATNPKRYPLGPPAELLVDGRPPVVEFPDALTVRYTWDRPNPFFLPLLAGAKPVEIYAPAHYLKQFHPRYTDHDTLKKRVEEAKQKGWAQLHNKKDDLTEFNNVDLPTLQPWRLVTPPPADRFVFERNPYFHRVDPDGRPLPYIDRLVMNIADAKIIPAKVGSGESDLQARYLRFDNYTFLKSGEKRNHYQVRLWRNGMGAQMALYPNLNCSDPVWRSVNRDARYRRALSLAINRDEINQVIYYGLADPSHNGVLPESPLWVFARQHDQRDWIRFDIKEANRLLDSMGLTGRDLNGTRLLPDGRPMEVVVETAGESTEELDALELIADSWRRLGIRLFPRTSQLDVFRNRIFAGETVMSIARGLDNGVPSASMSPAEFVPLAQVQYQWPRWGQFHETRGKEGEAPDLDEAKELLDAFRAWRDAIGNDGRREAWHRILAISADQMFSIGVVAGVPQPVVVRDTLRNVPDKALFNYDPGAHFGLFHPDSFWLDRP